MRPVSHFPFVAVDLGDPASCVCRALQSGCWQPAGKCSLVLHPPCLFKYMINCLCATRANNLIENRRCMLRLHAEDSYGFISLRMGSCSGARQAFRMNRSLDGCRLSPDILSEVRNTGSVSCVEKTSFKKLVENTDKEIINAESQGFRPFVVPFQNRGSTPSSSPCRRWSWHRLWTVPCGCDQPATGSGSRCLPVMPQPGHLEPPNALPYAAL